jgi:rhamnose utilization protein RhaD (predicted bifunctional aldolase and dehydrogenase)
MESELRVRERLHRLAHWLGDPVRDLSILAEGNVSAAIDDASFWLKASGCQLGSMRTDQFVRMDTVRTLELLRTPTATDPEIKAALCAARTHPDDTLIPSVEAALHAVCLTEGRARVVGHTHPTPWLSILCSDRAEEALQGRLFPDEIVVCGPGAAFVGYVDPGPPLAHACQEALRRYLADWGEPAKVLLLQNHGLFVLGQDADEVERITAMSVKVARALLGALAVGSPRFLSDDAVRRIHTRPDEAERRLRLQGSGG